MSEPTPDPRMPRYARRPMRVMMLKDANGWQVMGILPSTAEPGGKRRRELVRDDGASQIFCWDGMDLVLVPDGCDDYWFNLTSEQPRLYVICQRDAEGAPTPTRITADQDDAVAAEEVDELFYQAEMPVPIVFWIRDYVATHWRPGPRKQKIAGKEGDKYRQGGGRRRP
ncbi:MAG: DUF3305 domain-containing protein [Wenzhouxiangella sp.]